ncbi:MAG TPA: hypothetical protein VGK42_10310, partial [Candidatus Dormibacteraeota bacterium]
ERPREVVEIQAQIRLHRGHGLNQAIGKWLVKGWQEILDHNSPGSRESYLAIRHFQLSLQWLDKRHQ